LEQGGYLYFNMGGFKICRPYGIHAYIKGFSIFINNLEIRWLGKNSWAYSRCYWTQLYV